MCGGAQTDRYRLPATACQCKLLPQVGLKGGCDVRAVYQLLGTNTTHPLDEGIRLAFRQHDDPLCHGQPRQTKLVAWPLMNAQYAGLCFIAEEFGLGECARRHDADDAAFNGALARDLAKLLANRHRLA